jgi:hypothetical protein
VPVVCFVDIEIKITFFWNVTPHSLVDTDVKDQLAMSIFWVEGVRSQKSVTLVFTGVITSNPSSQIIAIYGSQRATMRYGCFWIEISDDTELHIHRDRVDTDIESFY